jgi:beta-lactamase superfamily II metal-dependent hydrolase
VGDHNSGRDLIAPLLRQRGVKELDGVVISHAHYDHFGGFAWLVDADVCISACNQ